MEEKIINVYFKLNNKTQIILPEIIEQTFHEISIKPENTSLDNAELIITDDINEIKNIYKKPIIIIWDRHNINAIEELLSLSNSQENLFNIVNNIRGIFTYEEIKELRRTEFINCLNNIKIEIKKKKEIHNKIRDIKENKQYQRVGQIVRYLKTTQNNRESSRFSALFFDKPMLDLLRKISYIIDSMKDDLLILKENVLKSNTLAKSKSTKDYKLITLYDDDKKSFNYENIKTLVNLSKIYDIHLEPILITGQTGAGKTLISRWIHKLCGELLPGELVEINASGLSEELMESELFGYTKGSFTGAENDKPGLALRALGGVLFLDEIGDIPLSLQPRIMKFIEEFKFKPKGWDKEYDIYCPCLIILATNKDLQKEVELGRFRQDFLARLRHRISVPSLKERINSLNAIIDVLLLAKQENYDKIQGISYECINTLKGREYRENFRELERIIHNAILNAKLFDADIIISEFLEEN